MGSLPGYGRAWSQVEAEAQGAEEELEACSKRVLQDHATALHDRKARIKRMLLEFVHLQVDTHQLATLCDTAITLDPVSTNSSFSFAAAASKAASGAPWPAPRVVAAQNCLEGP